MLVVNTFSAAIALATSAVKLTFVELILVDNPFSAAIALVTSAAKLAVVEVILAVLDAILVAFVVMLDVFELTLVSSADSAAVALATSAANNAFKLPLELEMASEILVETVVPNKFILLASTVESDLDFPASTVESVINLFTNRVESLLDFTSATPIRALIEASAAIALVTSAVKLAVVELILVVKTLSAAIALATSAVILAVLDAILVSLVVTLVGNFEIVSELTPATELIVVVKVPVPDPLTSPVKVINWSPEFTPPSVTSPITVKVVTVLVPPEILNPFAKAVGLTPLIVLFVNACVLDKVA